jgi:uncharacterized surface protein with fasciclin (FAS1) repeats
MKNIIETAVANTDFSTLVTAIKAADLVDTLSGDGPFTVFAPTNEAFAKIEPEKLKAILADKKKLTSILTYHVVSGKVLAADVAKISEAKTLQGGKIRISLKGSSVMINESEVLKTDIHCSNGIIHVIDTVLIP